MTIIDANDHSPQFEDLPYMFSVVENNEISQLIGQAIATDQDSGRNAELQYSIVAGIVLCTVLCCCTQLVFTTYSKNVV